MLETRLKTIQQATAGSSTAVTLSGCDHDGFDAMCGGGTVDHSILIQNVIMKLKSFIQEDPENV